MKFLDREGKKRPLVASLKKKFDLLKKDNLKPLSVNDLAEVIN